MTRKCLLLPLVGAALTASVGCGTRTDLFPVAGKVVYQGTPAVGATVTFVRKESDDRLTEQVPQGVVREDGSFTLASPLGEGAKPGEYAVLIEWKEGAGQVKGRSPGLSAPDRLQKRYLDPNQPLLTATIRAESNSLAPFELK